MVQKKGRIIRDFILNWLQTQVINTVVTELNLPTNVITAINILNNIDKISIIALVLSKLGPFKFLAYIAYIALAA